MTVTTTVHRRRAALVALLALVACAPAAVIEDAVEMSPAAQQAINKGLAWLAHTQRADGSWPGEYGQSCGIVSACAIAFMAAGNTPDSGEYGTNLAKALRYIQRSAQPNGLLYKPGMAGAAMYNHGLATLGLSEAWGMSQDASLRETVKRAIDLMVAIQNPEGGWRYSPFLNLSEGVDISSTVMQLMALRASNDAGVYVPKETIDKGIAYVKRCHNAISDGKDGGFAYQPNGESGMARTAAGVLSLQVAGKYRAGEVKEGIQYLLGFYPLAEKKENDQFFIYGQYYAAMGIYQAQSLGEWGRDAWRRWYPAVTKMFVEGQKPDGHWDGPFDEYPTAIAVLVLSIPYRYLPVYQR